MGGLCRGAPQHRLMPQGSNEFPDLRLQYHYPRAMMDFLREATYELCPSPLASLAYGFEFEERHRIRA